MKYLLITLFTFSLNAIMAQEFEATHIRESAKNIPSLKRFGKAFYSVSFDWEGMSGFSANLKRFIHSIEIKKFDDDLNAVLSLSVSGGERIYGPIEPALAVINSKLYLLYYKMTGKENIKLFCAPIDTATLQVSEASDLLDINTDETYLKYYMRSAGLNDENRTVLKDYYINDGLGMTKTFFLVPSPDKSKYVVLWNSGFDKKIFFSVLDANLRKLRSSIIELKDEMEVKINNAMLDDKGNMYLAFAYKIKTEPKAMIYISKPDGNAVKKEILLTDADPFGIYAAMGQKDNKIFICGAYKQKGNYIAGIYAQTLRTTDFILSEPIKTVFPEELVKISEDDGWGNNKARNYGLSDNLFFKLYPLSNGTFSLIGEFKARIDFQRSSVFITGNLLYTTFDNNKARFTRIPKFRAEQSSYFSPIYTLLEYQDKVLLFYNDHIKNINKDIKEKAYRSGINDKVIYAVAIISKDGAINRKIIINEGSRKYLSIADDMMFTSPTSFIIPFYRKEMYGLGKIDVSFKWELITVD